jgi:hypothetical protein
MKINSQAALLAAVGGVLLLVVGYSGVRGVDHFFDWLVAVFGPRAWLTEISRIFGGIASLGGVAVLLGGYLIFKGRVRSGRILILIGSGAGFFTLLLFVFVNLWREAFSYLLDVLPAILGIAFGVAAQLWAKPEPIL